MSIGPVTPASAASGAPLLATSPSPSAVASPAAPPQTVVETPAAQLALLAALAEPESLARLLDDLATAGAALPKAVQATAAEIVTTQAPLTADVTAQSLREAAQKSGIFLEASLADHAPNPDDRKALLLRLLADLPETGSPEDDRLVESVRRNAQGALAHIELSQSASIPKPDQPILWSFETAALTPQGPTVAQFEISRDGGGTGGQDGEQVSWRTRFSLNLEPSGPVHAEVMLAGGRTRVTLWAERPDALSVLAASQDELTSALAEAPDADVAVRFVAGAPPRPSGRAGQLLDRRS